MGRLGWSGSGKDVSVEERQETDKKHFGEKAMNLVFDAGSGSELSDALSLR